MTLFKRFLGLRGRALTTTQVLTIVAPSYIIFGYNQANLGGLVNLADFVKTFPRIDTVNTTGAQENNNATIQGLVVATFTLGAMFGCFSCSWSADRYGRRMVVFLGTVLTLIGEILEASAYHLAQLIVSRVVLGFGVGMLSGTVPTLQSECSTTKNRGKNVVLVGLFIALGFVLESWINFGFYEYDESGVSPVTWRPPIGISGFFSIFLLVFVFLMPESPRWLVCAGRIDEARETLCALRDLPPDAESIRAELAAVEMSLEASSHGQTGKVSIREMMSNGEDKLLYRFIICIMLQFFQQMTGGNLISVYSTILFEEGLGMNARTARILSGGTLTWKLLACFPSFFTIDRFGRRICLMISGAGMSACMLGLAVATSFPTSNYPAQVVSVLFVFLFNFFMPIGFLGANFLYCTEVAPLRLRVAMASISTANHWLWNFVVVMITPVAISSIGYQYYIVYAVIGACIPLSIYLFYPETMNISLEDIDLIFRQSPSVMGTVKYARTKPHLTVDVLDTKVKSDSVESA